jgi:hypothetical protein
MVGAAGAAGAAAGAAGAAGAAAAAELQATHRRHRWRTGSRRSYRLHSGGSGGGLETSRSTGGGPEPADIEGARSRIHGPAAERPVLGLGEPESTHRWTGTTCRAAPLACSDWSEERDVGRSRLDRVEGGITGSRVGRAVIHD